MVKSHRTHPQSSRIMVIARQAMTSPRKLIMATSRRNLPVATLCMTTHTTILRHTARSHPCRVFILPLFINHPWKMFTMALRSLPPTFRLYHLVFPFHTSRIRTPILHIIRQSAHHHQNHRTLSHRTLSYLHPTTQPTGMTRTRWRHTKMALGYWILSLIIQAYPVTI